MRATESLSSTLCLFVGVVAASWLTGCDDECKKGTSECLSPSLIRTCVQDEDGDPFWFTHQCKDDEICASEGAASMQGGSDGGASSTGAACAGTCEVGASECVSPELARYCVNGKVWQLDACDVGEACVDGVCRVGADGGVRACVPGTKACASERIEKVCDGDGTSWVEQPCAANEICMGTECMPDPRSSCDDGSRCLDNKTAIRCRGQDRGFELVECGGETWCEGGRCVGPNCALGSTCVGRNQVRECTDGVNFVDSQCGANEVCQQDKDLAGCVPRACNPGVTVCGDPEDEDADATKTYSTCVIGANTGVPEWRRGECSGNLMCDPAAVATGNPCRQGCTPGAEACTADAAAGIEDGYRVCQDDGTWGAVDSCNTPGSARRMCVLAPNTQASELPTHLCVEPICAHVIRQLGGRGGVCDGVQIRRCGEDGTLSDEASECEAGYCRTLEAPVQADGYVPGVCDDDVSCETGEERCVNDGVERTPIFQMCEEGEWSSALETCPEDALCLDWQGADGIRHKLCGADCVPGRRRCNDAGEIETCDEQGQWSGAEACSLGRCQATGSNDASCVLDCVPGETLCTGTQTLASDNAHFGTTMEVQCSAEGTLGEAPTACEGSETCRTTSTGAVQGCIECLGPNAPGGNLSGFVDSRCAPGDADRIQTCGAENTWGDGRTCSEGTTCVGPTGPQCGECLSAAGNMVECTETNIDDIQTCGPCNVVLDDAGTQTIGNCTETFIDALMPGATCNSQFGGSNVPWGGFDDCCDGDSGAYLLTTNATCSSMGYGTATAWAGTPDCCSEYRMDAAGPDFAYCAE